jgi:hypothetical protein
MSGIGGTSWRSLGVGAALALGLATAVLTSLRRAPPAREGGAPHRPGSLSISDSGGPKLGHVELSSPCSNRVPRAIAGF